MSGRVWIVLLVLVLCAHSEARALVPVATLQELSGENAGDLFGFSIAAAGDVNGDGFDDVIVGAPGNDAAGPDFGRAYVFYGGSEMDAVPDLVFTGPGDDLMFGISVGAAGDVDGDGYADVIVGAPSRHLPGPLFGRAFVYYGGPGADAAPDRVLQGDEWQFGNTVSTAGDVNQDGYADVLVGTGGSVRGDAVAQIFYGGPALSAFTLVLRSPYKTNAEHRAANAGDVNGDGDDDFIVVVQEYDPAGGPGFNRAHVYWGGPAADGAADWILPAPVQVPHQVSPTIAVGLGDTNGDGYGDIIVEGLQMFAGATYQSTASLYHGGATPDAIADLAATGSIPFDILGAWEFFSVGSAGDVDGDSRPDFLVGLSGFFGGAAIDGVADLQLPKGHLSAAAGDVNGDGLADIMTGRPKFGDNPGDEKGRVFLFTLEVPAQLVALDIDPGVLTANSRGNRVTAYVEPQGFDVASIVPSTVRLLGDLVPEPHPLSVGDHDLDGLGDLMLKFARSEILSRLAEGLNQVSVTGSLSDGRRFEGSSVVRVVQAPGQRGALHMVLRSPQGSAPFAVAMSDGLASDGDIRIYDVRGRMIRAWSNPRGTTFAWDGRASDGTRAGPGVYWLQACMGLRAGALKLVIAR